MITVKIPKRFESCDFNKDVPDVLKTQIGLLKSRATNEGIYYYGPTGVGKTHIAYACAKELVSSPNPIIVEFVSYSELLENIKTGYSVDHDKGSYMDIAHYENYRGVLFIDDLGSVKPNDFAVDTLYKIINERYNNCLPVFITSNLSPDEIFKTYGERLSSRIVEMCKLYKRDGSDLRYQLRTKDPTINA